MGWSLQSAEIPAPVANGLVSSLAPDHATSNGSQDVVMTNGIVKAEPADTNSLSNIAHNKDRSMWQCHKCHILKRTPPSSPSQVRPREKPPSEPAPAPAPVPASAPAPEPFAYQSSYAAPPPAAYPLNRTPLEGALPPPHSHPPGPPPPPPGAPLHQPPSWQSPSGWSSSAMPGGRRPSPPPSPSRYDRPPGPS